MAEISDEIERRRTEFHETFGGEEFFEETLIKASYRIAEVAAAVYGEDASEKAMNTLVGACFPAAGQGLGWKAALEEEANGIYSETPGGSLLHDLTAYADYGIVVAPCRTLPDRERLIEHQVAQGAHLQRLVGGDSPNPFEDPVARIVQTATARRKLESGNPIDAIELALLSGLALQTIKNLLSAKPRRIVGNQKRVESREALDWLSTQKKWRSTLLSFQDDTVAVAELDSFFVEPMFVPAAPDGSLFHPGLKRNGRYVVGNLGSELEFRDFDKALEALQSMSVPVWRRPTEKGRWTQVRGRKWVRRTRNELNEFKRANAEANFPTL